MLTPVETCGQGEWEAPCGCLPVHRQGDQKVVCLPAGREKNEVDHHLSKRNAMQFFEEIGNSRARTRGIGNDSSEFGG